MTSDDALKSGKEVVVVLPVREAKVLLQLRDLKDGIDCAGLWGFFGGAIELAESPEDAAMREIVEELGHEPSILYPLGLTRLKDQGNLISYAYWYPFEIDPEKIVQAEGMDMAWAGLDEVESGKVYSEKFKKHFSVAGNGYMQAVIRKALAYDVDHASY
jgi:8-oxo-dGTP pyrophosphatase MutT (NUDIX family)